MISYGNDEQENSKINLLDALLDETSAVDINDEATTDFEPDPEEPPIKKKKIKVKKINSKKSPIENRNNNNCQILNNSSTSASSSSSSSSKSKQYICTLCFSSKSNLIKIKEGEKFNITEIIDIEMYLQSFKSKRISLPMRLCELCMKIARRHLNQNRKIADLERNPSSKSQNRLKLIEESLRKECYVKIKKLNLKSTQHLIKNIKKSIGVQASISSLSVSTNTSKIDVGLNISTENDYLKKLLERSLKNNSITRLKLRRAEQLSIKTTDGLKTLALQEEKNQLQKELKLIKMNSENERKDRDQKIDELEAKLSNLKYSLEKTEKEFSNTELKHKEEHESAVSCLTKKIEELKQEKEKLNQNLKFAVKEKCNLSFKNKSLESKVTELSSTNEKVKKLEVQLETAIAETVAQSVRLDENAIALKKYSEEKMENESLLIKIEDYRRQIDSFKRKTSRRSIVNNPRESETISRLNLQIKSFQNEEMAKTLSFFVLNKEFKSIREENGKIEEKLKKVDLDIISKNKEISELKEKLSTSSTIPVIKSVRTEVDVRYGLWNQNVFGPGFMDLSIKLKEIAFESVNNVISDFKSVINECSINGPPSKESLRCLYETNLNNFVQTQRLQVFEENVLKVLFTHAFFVCFKDLPEGVKKLVINQGDPVIKTGVLQTLFDVAPPRPQGIKVRSMASLQNPQPILQALPQIRPIRNQYQPIYPINQNFFAPQSQKLPQQIYPQMQEINSHHSQQSFIQYPNGMNNMGGNSYPNNYMNGAHGQ